MVELRVLEGSRKGEQVSVSAVPFLIGRCSEAGLRLMDAGVWERHVELYRDEQGMFCLRTDGQSVLRVDGSNVQQHRLRNGESLDVGAARLAFWIAPQEVKSLKPTETALWMSVGALVVLEITLILGLIV